MALFGRAPKPDPAARRRVEAWIREAGGYGPDTAMTVNEIVCADPACPGTETVVLIFAPGEKTRAVKIAGALDALSEADVAAALGQD
ncbi:hypothetical protein [Methylobacterium sp. R2-1]|uniref:hypothetical protein n=1 Tax=Methylobacterium sp. R2-1 TaxID=2587064 RepID=UPI001613FAAF|nr:hypothetical protein [Methylobacterium sp. R2-1]MBB2963579.1 hypothetical protein [Methylobacterium sp. R2-1]